VRQYEYLGLMYHKIAAITEMSTAFQKIIAITHSEIFVQQAREIRVKYVMCPG